MLYHLPRNKTTVPSLIKWTGSKRVQAKTIIQYVPAHSRYIEPFLGGGAVLYLLGKPGAVAGDIYNPLIELWMLIQSEPNTVIENYSNQWLCLQEESPDYYYNVRDRFNLNPNALDLNFLVRTCVNGIIRFNREGKFNNSFHLSRRGMAPERFAKSVKDWHSVIQGVTFTCQDYEDTLSGAKQGDFVYLDPPYAGNNMRYTSNLDVSRFLNQLEELNKKGVKWGLSFDGWRGTNDFSYPIPRDLYSQKILIPNGNSAIGKVLNGPVEQVRESLYLNY